NKLNKSPTAAYSPLSYGSQLSQSVRLVVCLSTMLSGASAWGHESPDGSSTDTAAYADPSGEIATLNVNGRTDRRGACFQSPGTNGRSCDTCHQADQAMSFTPAQARERYQSTHGHDPLFAAVDGANCSTVKTGDRSGHSLLLQHGLIRIALSVPAN